MNLDRLDWDLARSFLAVMRSGSLSGAARRLNTAQATVRRHIEGLEGLLGVALFLRTPAGLAPTEAAQAALPHAEALESGMAALARSVATGVDIAGAVRITCSEVIGVEILPAILAPLVGQYPALGIELIASNDMQDLVRRDADIALRMVRPVQSSLIARKIGTIPVGLFATAAYLAGHPPVERVDDLRQHRLIGDDRGTRVADALTAAGLSDPRFALRVDNDVAQLAAIRAGLGIGACQRALAARPPTLVNVLPEIAQSLDLWIAVHADLRAVPRVATVFDHLAAGLADYIEHGR